MAIALPELDEDQAGEILRTLGYTPPDRPEGTDGLAYQLGAVVAVTQAHLARADELEAQSASRGYHDAYTVAFGEPCPCGEHDQ